MILSKVLEKLALNPQPARILLLRAVTRRLRLGSFQFRQALGALRYPGYAYCMYQSALLARALGHDAISAIEFGVAGGNGLLAMEEHAQEIANITSVKVRLFGFDTGEGLPAPEDYRDLPYHWRQGSYRVERDKLLSCLSNTTTIHWGAVRDSLRQFFKQAPPPIGAIFFDLDFYSSTRDAFAIFQASKEQYLPRLFCYFDDILDGDFEMDNPLNLELFNDWTGEQGAINDFNREHAHQKIARRQQNVGRYVNAPWLQKVFVYHDFDHPEYCNSVTTECHQLPMSER